MTLINCRVFKLAAGGLVILQCLPLIACSFSVVELTPGGKAVQVSDSLDNAADCRLIGHVQGAARSYISGDVEEQRDASARNKAAEIKGTRVVRNDVTQYGVRNYDVYQCQNAASSSSKPDAAGAAK
jgi:ABC-type microcin C transport system permease subunit YejB